MQGELFDEADDGHNDHVDPYDELRADAAGLCEEYAITTEKAFELMVAYGSKTAALRHLRQMWWSGDVQMRDPPIAA